MKLTATSNPIIPMNTANGIKVRIENNILLVNNLNKNDDKIASSVLTANKYKIKQNYSNLVRLEFIPLDNNLILSRPAWVKCLPLLIISTPLQKSA